MTRFFPMCKTVVRLLRLGKRETMMTRFFPMRKTVVSNHKIRDDGLKAN